MSRQKIDYGIDLGTTNSAIARVNDGSIRVFQIGSSLVLPSCVHFTKNQMFVGQKAHNRLRRAGDNTFYEFKRMMGTDHVYHSSNTGTSYTPEELSAEVLKELKAWVKDDQFSWSVITVPAAFQQPQIEATQRAAELAGFEYCELLQEPIAASLAFLYDEKNLDGIWLVFDLGGGTFDAALVRMEDGIMKVVDHAGDNYLGGKNMDLMLVDEIIIPYLANNFSIAETLNNENQKEELRKAWKYYAEEAKIALSDKTSYVIEPDEPVCKDDNGEEIDANISIARSDFEALISPLIDRAVKICNDLIAKNNLSPVDLLTVLMVGGPTYISILREKVKSCLCENINVSIDPMTAVAKGAAVFASTKSIPVEKQKRDYSKIQLTLAHPDTTVETEVALGIKMEREKTSGPIPLRLFAEITRNDKDWGSGKVAMESGVGIVHLRLMQNTTNGFTVEIFDERGNRVACEPDSFSILQGVKVAQPPLPQDIGVSAVVIDEANEELMVPILTKGTPLPADGKKKFKAPKDLRAGNKSDELKVIVWEGRGETRPIRNQKMGEIIITGEMLPSLLPKESEVEVTIRMDESRRCKVTAYLPYLDETIERVLDTGYTGSVVDADELSKHIEMERGRIADIEEKILTDGDLDGDRAEELKDALDELENLNEKGHGDADRSMEVQKRLNEIGENIDKIETEMKWPQLKDELSQELQWTEEVVERFGDEKHEKILSKLGPEVENAIDSKNFERAKDVLDRLRELKWKILLEQPGYWVSVLNNINESFDEIQWNDPSKAKAFLDRGRDLLASGYFSDEIKSIVWKLWDLMPIQDQEKTKEVRTDILHY